MVNALNSILIFHCIVSVEMLHLPPEKSANSTEKIAIPAEGGGNVKPKPLDEHPQPLRDHQLVANANQTIQNTSAKVEKATNISANNSENTSILPTSTSNASTILHKNIVPRKGVEFSQSVDSQSPTPPPIVISSNSTAKTKVKKPLVTLPSNDEPFNPSHFQSHQPKTNASQQSQSSVPLWERYTEEKQTQKYVVPIVLIILSVPFVAIIISSVYKRGADWWKYRHYRRMDFLINGIYDN